ncbi:hypothetical protein [Acidiphilium iwatense]|uniref:Uncharacterized protein n=1 Tax=Acidiphilium iwatense TaxID=768198 RepID=A0ABS9DY19_9PROT|nr:hypothetical protein [Acidiphilium iwatense]MCF3946586.1 hypothetical protein [Acidiphilium iwatense]
MSRTGKAIAVSGARSNDPMVRQRGVSSCSATARRSHTDGQVTSRECRLGV